MSSNVIGIAGGTAGTVLTAFNMYVNDDVQKIQDKTKGQIKQKTEGMVRVVAVTDVEEKIKAGSKWITITGNAGDGKTTTGFMVLERFQAEMDVYKIDTPNEYYHISKRKKKRMLLLNDIFGCFTLDRSNVETWMPVIRDILDYGDDQTQTTVLFVSRKSILNESKDHLEHYKETITGRKSVVDLGDYYQNDERNSILDFHLERKKIPLSPVKRKAVAEMKTPHGFPHCCKLYADLKLEGQNIDIVEFFKSPLAFLDQTTRSLFENGCEDLFINMLRNGGKFDVSTVTEERERRNLRRKAVGQEGNYLKKIEEGVWSFSHPSIYESVLSVMAERDPLFLALNVDLSVILQKLRFSTPGCTGSSRYIFLQPEKTVISALCGRFRKEILQKDYTIFGHNLCKNRKFCGELLSSCVQRERSTQQETLNINERNMYGLTMLMVASMYGNTIAVQCLVEHGADVNMEDVIGMNALHYLCDSEKADAETIRTLATTGRRSILEKQDMSGMAPLHFLCKKGSNLIDALKTMVDELKCDVNKVGPDGMTPLHFLCQNKKARVEEIQLLLSHGADDLYDNFGRNGLSYLSEIDFDDLSLLSKRLSVNVKLNKAGN